VIIAFDFLSFHWIDNAECVLRWQLTLIRKRPQTGNSKDGGYSKLLNHVTREISLVNS